MRLSWFSPHTTRSPHLTLLALSIFSGVQARAQTPSAEMPAAATPLKTTKLSDLTNRYRFSEQYTREDKPAPGLVGPYRVAIIEVARDSVDSPQGAPRQMEASRQTIFVERPAELIGAGVSATVRSIERFRARPEDPSRMMGPRPLEGLTILIRPRTGELPAIQSLTEGRQLTAYEFEVAARQVFIPSIVAILPAKSVRLGDTWQIPRRAAQAMLGEPGIQGDTLVGKLVELSKEVDGPRMVAQFSVTGKAPGASGDIVVNAEVLFTFQPESTLKGFSTAPSFPPRPSSDVVEARGGITEVRFGRLTTAELPGPGRLRFRANREVIVHRQLALGPNAVGPARLVDIPPATEANTWLTYLEPSRKFSFQHPQDLLSPDRGPIAPLEPNAASLVRIRGGGIDRLEIEFTPKTLAPEALKQKMAARWAAMKLEVIPGTEEWLPEADWPKMKVHRIEAAVKVVEPKARSGVPAAPGSTRIHFDGYLVQFGQSASILAIATTSRDAVAPYRREVEQILKSIQIGPPTPR
jgi:hypothetical protein